MGGVAAPQPGPFSIEVTSPVSSRGESTVEAQVILAGHTHVAVVARPPRLDHHQIAEIKSAHFLRQVADRMNSTKDLVAEDARGSLIGPRDLAAELVKFRSVDPGQDYLQDHVLRSDFRDRQLADRNLSGTLINRGTRLSCHW